MEENIEIRNSRTYFKIKDGVMIVGLMLCTTYKTSDNAHLSVVGHEFLKLHRCFNHVARAISTSILSF